MPSRGTRGLRLRSTGANPAMVRVQPMRRSRTRKKFFPSVQNRPWRLKRKVPHALSAIVKERWLFGEGASIKAETFHAPIATAFTRAFRPFASDEIAAFLCHPSIRAELMRQSHHPIREGKTKCSDCHNPHGTVADKLVDAQDVNQKCFGCHADLRGPFLWDHPPVIEDCLACHTPHGSPRTPLLKAKMPYLCQRCHSNVGHASQLQAKNAGDAGQVASRVLNNRGFYRACLNCHVSIHGSNHPSGKSCRGSAITRDGVRNIPE
jgi:predicted CXXCH cytochrome family protein